MYRYTPPHLLHAQAQAMRRKLLRFGAHVLAGGVIGLSFGWLGHLINEYPLVARLFGLVMLLSLVAVLVVVAATVIGRSADE
jgi:hypothetical protein